MHTTACHSNHTGQPGGDVALTIIIPAPGGHHPVLSHCQTEFDPG